MPTYFYRAKDKSGGTVDGTLDAPDTRAAVGMVREMGYWPLDVREEGKKAVPKGCESTDRRFPLLTGVSIRSLALFFRQLATMLQAGMSLSEGLDSLGRQRGLGRLPVIALRAADQVRTGGLFSDVLANHPHIFSRLQVGLIRAGETGGMLDSMVDRVASYLERELALRHKFSRVTFYPKIIVVFIVAAVLFIPHVAAIMNGGWQIIAQIILRDAFPVALWLVAMYAAIRLLLTVQPIRYVWDMVKLSFPVLGSTARKLAMSRFSTGLSVMYSAGIPLSQAVELSSDALGNEVLHRAVLRAVPQLRAGGQLSEAFRQTGGLPEMVIGMIGTGERTGSMDQVLDKVSEYYDSEAETTLEKFGYVLFAMLILGAGVVVAIIVARFYLGYFGGLSL